MLRRNFFLQHAAALLCLLTLSALSGAAQERTTGGIRGRVRVASGSASGINVTVRQGDNEVARTTTDRRGEFEFRGLAPGSYGLTFRKPGLQVGRMEDVEVRAGRVVSLKDRLYLPVDEGSIAFIRGSVFDPSGRSVGGARVELALLQSDGSLKKLDSRVTTEYGTFAFRLPPDAARYRVTVKADGMEAASQDVEVDSAAVFRVAVTLTPAAK